MTNYKRLCSSELVIIVFLVVGGAFSFYIAGSRLLACGRELAGFEIYIWLGLAAVQSVLFLFAPLRPALQQLYRWSQLLCLPLAMAVLGQLALAYSGAFIWLALMSAAYWLPNAIRHGLHNSIEWSYSPGAIGRFAVETTLFILAWVLIHSVLAFVWMHVPGVAMGDSRFLVIGIISALIAAIVVRKQAPVEPLSVSSLPPLGLLLLVLLRAKLPDAAYDSLFYKATLPLLLADWRTAITGVMDHTLVGTNLFEIVNAQARILDPGYSPALISTFSFLAMWVIVPVAARTLFDNLRDVSSRSLAANTCALLIVSLTEPLTAAGTAYHEPILSLLLTASLLPMTSSWLFLGAAIAGKVTAIFILPVVLLLKAQRFIVADRESTLRSGSAAEASAFARSAVSSIVRSMVREVRLRPLITTLCLVLALLAVGEQFHRNLVFTGRLMGVSELLSGWTDPGGKVLSAQERDPAFDAVTQRKASEKYGKTLVHVLTLDRWIVPDEMGFHILPTSRLIAIAALLSIAVIAFPSLRRDPTLALLFGSWAVCAFAMLHFFSQGRHIFPLSFAAAPIVAVLVSRLVSCTPGGERQLPSMLACMAISVVAIGDQVVGSFIHNGWDCRRPLLTRVEVNNFDHPVTPIEKRLSELVEQYRRRQPAQSGVPPTVLCEHGVERMHYLGTHYVYTHTSLMLTLRRVMANPDLASLLPTSILAICFSSEKFLEHVIPASQRAEFEEVAGVGDIRIMVSKRLAAGEPATSILRPDNGWLTSTLRPATSGNLLAEWRSARLTDYSPVSTPNGRGALSMSIKGEEVAVLVSPFGVIFDNVQFPQNSSLHVSMAMPYSNSDGMTVEFVFEGLGGVRHSIPISVPAKPALAGDPSWEERDIPIPSFLGEAVRIKVIASSPTGDGTADWIYFRRLTIGSRS